MITNKNTFNPTRYLSPRSPLRSIKHDFTDWLILRTLPTISKNMRQIPLILFRMPHELRHQSQKKILTKKNTAITWSPIINLSLQFESFLNFFQTGLQNYSERKSHIDSIPSGSWGKFSFLGFFNTFLPERATNRIVPLSLNVFKVFPYFPKQRAFRPGSEKREDGNTDDKFVFNRVTRHHHHAGMKIVKNHFIGNMIENKYKAYSTNIEAPAVHNIIISFLEKNSSKQFGSPLMLVNATGVSETVDRSSDSYIGRNNPLAIRNHAGVFETFHHFKKNILSSAKQYFVGSGRSGAVSRDGIIPNGEMLLRTSTPSKSSADHQSPYLFPPEMKLAMPLISNGQLDDNHKIDRKPDPLPSQQQLPSEMDIDMSKLTDKVYDEIKRKIRISRERRGL